MGKIQVITDSASDISYENEKRYNIHIIPFPVVIGEKSYLSRVDMDNEGFYKLMEEQEDVPKTSQITSYQFEELYYECYQKGCTDVILVMINSKGSATYQNSLLAIDTFFEEHPECEGKISIYSHDGRSYSGAYGQPVIRACQMAEAGASAEEINRYLEDILVRRCVYFGIYNLKYAGRSGRIPSAAAFVGDKLGIKPIMKIWDSEITTAAKCRGEKKVVAKIADMTVAEMEPGSEYQVVYGSDQSCADEMIQKMTEKVGYGPTEVYQIGVAVAANAGPKVSGILFDRKK